jgi:hypothetical protein
MATFKEEFAKRRAELGAGKTFTWKDKNGKVGTYSTDYATEKKQAAPTASDKPAARPAGLNPKSGASRSTAGKVAEKAKAKPMTSASARPEGKAAGMPKAKPAMSMMDKAKAEATAARDKAKASNKPKTPAAPAKSDAAYSSKIGPKKETTFERMKRALTTKGGFSKFKG